MYRKNVAGQFLYFALVNATTGAALTGATVTAKRSIDGAAQASCTGTVAEDAGGQYHIALSQADTNGNNIGYLFTAANAIPVNISIVTTAADPTDALAFGLSRIDATISSRLASASYSAPLDAAGTRSAVGLASANLDTQLGAIPTANANADALLDRANGVETSWTFRQVMRIIFSALAGKADGAATTTMHFRDQADLKNRITATVDANGNRTAVTLDAS